MMAAGRHNDGKQVGCLTFDAGETVVVNSRDDDGYDKVVRGCTCPCHVMGVMKDKTIDSNDYYYCFVYIISTFHQ